MPRSRLGHVNLNVDDLDRALAFYTGLVDLEVTERHAGYVFLSFGEQHHDLALQAVDGVDASEGATRGADDTPAARRVGLYHVAFELDTPAALADCYEWLSDRGHPVSPVDHGISKALYTDDPAGNGVECYVDTRVSGPDRWDGRNVRFDPRTL